MLTIFGKNLRSLIEARGTQAAAARDLGIGRIQLQRYLRGESFPNPLVLKRICDYFAIDARILTEPLDKLVGRKSEASCDGTNAAMIEAVNYACEGQAYFEPSTQFPDGIYNVWRRSLVLPGKVYRLPILIRTLGTARVARGFDLWVPEHGPRPVTSRQLREFRGIVHRQQIGFSISIYHRDPWRVLSFVYLSPIDVNLGEFALAGYAALGRNALPGLTRLSRTIWIRAEPTLSGGRDAFREWGYYDEHQVPELILALISPPV